MHSIQRLVVSVKRQKLLMRSMLHKFSAAQTVNIVRILHRGETVRNDDCRAVAAEALHRLLHQRFGLVVQCGSRLVEDQNRRILQKYAGNGYALFLTAGKTHAAFPGRRIKTLGQSHDEIVNVGILRGFDQFIFGRVKTPEQNIVADRRIEQERALLDNADIPRK